MRVFAVLLAFAADLAWNLAGAFWGFSLLALLVLWIALNQAHIATGSKAYRTEERLNAAMPRIPNPQNSPGTASNGSYGPTNSSYSPGNSSYTTSNGSYDVSGTPTAADFNALRDSFSAAVAAFNAHIGDHGNFVVAMQTLRTDHSNLVSCVGTLRTDHSNLISSHNTLLTTLGNTNILH